MKLASVWVAAVFVVGCSKADSGTPSASRPANGKERGDCVAPKQAPGEPKDDFAVGTCDPGLLCLSNLCVRPPPADCQAIGELLASFDLGNYAEPEERAPVVDKYKRACHKAMVSKEQGACIEKATDKSGAFQCAPLMFPEMGKPPAEAGSGTDCEQIATLTRAAMAKSVGSTQDPQMLRMLDGVVVAMRESCEQDAWPDNFKQCILSAGENTDAMNRCNGQMPPDLQQKLTERMMKIVQPQAPQPPTTPF
ncbi:MAG: hypothetical protein AB7T06_18540 [Kofleriaceae bacterium]